MEKVILQSTPIISYRQKINSDRHSNRMCLRPNFVTTSVVKNIDFI